MFDIKKARKKLVEIQEMKLLTMEQLADGVGVSSMTLRRFLKAQKMSLETRIKVRDYITAFEKEHGK